MNKRVLIQSGGGLADRWAGGQTWGERCGGRVPMTELSDFQRGLLLGILIGEGHFGGDGKQPHVTLRMHTRHQRVFETLLGMFPESKLYGPYTHGGRSYFQWMMRGQTLRESLIPLLDELPLEQTDEHAYERYQDMKRRYGL